MGSPVIVAIVHYRSGGMMLDLLRDLGAQDGVDLDIHIVESGDDGTLARARSEFPAVTVHDPRRNAGYAGGNNIVFETVAGSAPVLIVNPDVRIPAPDMLSGLIATLEDNPRAAAVAPVIRTDTGMIEYVGSTVDRRRALVIHAPTHVARWPSASDHLDLEWLDGACLLLRRQAIDDIGMFDERFFLIVEEVDWCLRARDLGWSLLLARDSEILHQRSSSFEGSTKSAYYSARNTYLLFNKHASGLAWRLRWLMRVCRLSLGRSHRRSGASRAVMNGAWDALRGRWGPAPPDRTER